MWAYKILRFGGERRSDEEDSEECALSSDGKWLISRAEKEEKEKKKYEDEG